MADKLNKLFANHSRFTWLGPEFNDASEVVTFIVSKDGIEEKFLVHKGKALIFTIFRGILEAAFTSSFIEGQTQEYQLEDTNPKIFRLLVQWFYNQKFKHRISKALDSTEVDKDGLTTLDHIYLNLAQLYIVAERLIILKLKGDISLSITMMAGDTWSTAWMKVAFEATTDNSALRQIAVKMCVDQVPSEWVLEHRNDFSYDLLIEVLAGMKSDQKHQYTPPSAQKFVWDERSVLPANSKEEYLTCRLLE